MYPNKTQSPIVFAAAASYALVASDRQMQECIGQFAGNVTMVLPAAPVGTELYVLFRQDNPGGRTITWDGTATPAGAAVFPGAGTGAPALGVNEYSLFRVYYPTGRCIVTKVIT